MEEIKIMEGNPPKQGKVETRPIKIKIEKGENIWKNH